MLTPPLVADNPPNILFILADDLGQHQIGCYGTKFYETPHVDKLASQGMRFTDAYAASPVCSPTRASIMTGKHPARLHLTEFIPGSQTPPKGSRLKAPEWTKELRDTETTIAELLKSGGYVSGHFGKWHLNKNKKYRPGRAGDPGSQGFEDVLTTHKPGAGPESVYPDDWHHVRSITQRAIEFMEKNKDQPFFCYVSHNSIHSPLKEEKKLVDKYKSKKGSTDKNQNPVMGAMVERLDRSVGSLLAALERFELNENTIVVFFLRQWMPLRFGIGQTTTG